MKDIDKFDSLFFGVHGQLVTHIDPMIRMTVESAYEAIMDSGINPKKLKGSKSAVFTASCFSDSELSMLLGKTKVHF